MAAHPDATTARTPIGKVLGIALALVGVVAVIVLAFAWPAVTAEPNDLPVAIAGPAQAISAAEQAGRRARAGRHRVRRGRRSRRSRRGDRDA